MIVAAPTAYGFSDQILVPVAINASGRNNTFFRSDYLLSNGRGATQEILVGFIAAGVTNVTLRQADIFDLPFAAHSFDDIFVCFVLEHLVRPLDALKALKGCLKVGGTITVIEGVAAVK